jgi:hypothetical protein
MLSFCLIGAALKVIPQYGNCSRLATKTAVPAVSAVSLHTGVGSHSSLQNPLTFRGFNVIT